MYLTRVSESRLLMQVKFGAPTRLKKLTPCIEICPAYYVCMQKKWNDSMGQDINELSYLEFLYNCCYDNSSAAIHVPALIIINNTMDPIGQNLQV